MKTDISTDDILEALQAALATAPVEAEGFLTMRQWIEASGWGKCKLRNALVRLKAMQRLEVRFVPETSLSGVTGKVPAYRIKT